MRQAVILSLLTFGVFITCDAKAERTESQNLISQFVSALTAQDFQIFNDLSDVEKKKVFDEVIGGGAEADPVVSVTTRSSVRSGEPSKVVEPSYPTPW